MRRRRTNRLWLTILLSGCIGSSSPELGMRSSDSEFMHQFVTELRAAQVQFRTDVDGMIRYHARDKDLVNAIAERVRKEMSTGTSLKFEQDEQKRHFLAELDAAKKKYRIETRPDGEWIRWYPDNEIESQELPARALEKWVAARRGKTPACDSASNVGGDAPPNLARNKDAAKAGGAC